MIASRIGASVGLGLGVLSAALAGCFGLDRDPGWTDQALFDGTPEAVGVLRFLNGPDATLQVLDIDAALDVRAARNIVAHVRGADGELGTADDDLLDDLAELDAISYVGPSAMDKLVAYVESIGGIPNIEVEGVALTAAEVDLIVMVANEASQSQLDDDAALDARAARNLVAARPLADIDTVAAVPWVGPSAIEKLREYAPTWTPPSPPEPEECDTVITGRADSDVERFDELLRRATMGDWPYAEMVAAQAPPCVNLDDAVTRDNVVDALVLYSGIDWQYGPDVYPNAASLYRDTSEYLRFMNYARMAIQEHVDDGSWDPSATPEDAALWADFDSLYDSLTARATADAGAFREVPLWIDAEECSQDAIALVDNADLRIWIIHRFPRC